VAIHDFGFMIFIAVLFALNLSAISSKTPNLVDIGVVHVCHFKKIVICQRILISAKESKGILFHISISDIPISIIIVWYHGYYLRNIQHIDSQMMSKNELRTQHTGGHIFGVPWNLES
jgi:hypothetical protein